jgi:hypothetical protein
VSDTPLDTQHYGLGILLITDDFLLQKEAELCVLRRAALDHRLCTCRPWFHWPVLPLPFPLVYSSSAFTGSASL